MEKKIFGKNDFKISAKYFDDCYIYKHIIISKNIIRHLKNNNKLNKLLSPKDLESIGIVNAGNWENYLVFKNEPCNILLRKKRYSCDEEEIGQILENNIYMKFQDY